MICFWLFRNKGVHANFSLKESTNQN